MKENLLEFLACPNCENTSVKLETSETDGVEILSGRLVCNGCGSQFPIVSGISIHVATKGGRSGKRCT